jgi:SulP family sulfate permease
LCLASEAIPDIDYTGGETIRQLHGELAEHGIKLVVAEPLAQVRELLERYGLVDLLGPDAIYDTVDDAVRAFAQTAPAG